MDDVTLSGDLYIVKKTLSPLWSRFHFSETGFQLNKDKCENIMDDFKEIDNLSTFKDFLRVKKDDMILLGSPIVKGKAQDKACLLYTSDAADE